MFERSSENGKSFSTHSSVKSVKIPRTKCCLTDLSASKNKSVRFLLKTVVLKCKNTSIIFPPWLALSCCGSDLYEKMRILNNKTSTKHITYSDISTYLYNHPTQTPIQTEDFEKNKTMGKTIRRVMRRSIRRTRVSRETRVTRRKTRRTRVSRVTRRKRHTRHTRVTRVTRMTINGRDETRLTRAMRETRDLNERNQTKTKNKFITIHLCFNSILSILFCLLNNSLIVSLWSIAKAPLCLRSPSIITSTHYRSIHHSSLWCSCLSFNLLESGLRPAMVSPDNEVLPNWVSKILFLLPVILLNLYSIKNSISTIYVSSYTCHALYIVSSNDQLCFVIVRITHPKNGYQGHQRPLRTN